MNKIKALFFDLDGTLLTSKKEISPKTRATLEKCKSNNIKRNAGQRQRGYFSCNT